MKSLHFNITTICVLIFSFFLACQPRRNKFVVVAVDTTIKAEPVSFIDLAKNYKSYHGKYVETKGLFGQRFEHFGLCVDSSELTNGLRCFWLSLDKDLNITEEDLQRMNRKIVRLRGLFDTTHKGHLSSYYGTIRDIYFWEQ